MLSYTLSIWREMILHALANLAKVEGDGTPCSYSACQCGGRWHSISGVDFLPLFVPNPIKLNIATLYI